MGGNESQGREERNGNGERGGRGMVRENRPSNNRGQEEDGRSQLIARKSVDIVEAGTPLKCLSAMR